MLNYPLTADVPRVEIRSYTVIKWPVVVELLPTEKVESTGNIARHEYGS